MKNIFENAYFGKVYKTRDGRKAIFHRNANNMTWYLICEDIHDRIPYNQDGTCRGDECHDIVSAWEEPINEEKLEELAEAYSSSIDNFPNEWFTKEHIKTLVECAYMVGYETAKKGD